MTNKWRPKNWKTKSSRDYEKEMGLATYEINGYGAGFEAGADAMLEALRKGGSDVYENETYTGMWLDLLHDEGVAVFIPNDEVGE